MKKEDEGHEDNKASTKTLSIEEFYRIATPEQNELLSDLYDAVQKEIEIAERINKIYRSIDTGIHCNGEGITVCESEDDANVISLGLKIELKEARSQVRMLLKKAVDELNMGNVGMIKRQYDNYVT